MTEDTKRKFILKFQNPGELNESALFGSILSYILWGERHKDDPWQ